MPNFNLKVINTTEHHVGVEADTLDDAIAEMQQNYGQYCTDQTQTDTKVTIRDDGPPPNDCFELEVDQTITHAVYISKSAVLDENHAYTLLENNFEKYVGQPTTRQESNDFEIFGIRVVD